MPRTYYVYLLASVSRNLYVGVTNDLQRRVFEHRSQRTPGLTRTYNITRLVYYEATADVRAALAREKQIKAWRREKKSALIEAGNPNWHDLSAEWADSFRAGRS